MIEFSTYLRLNDFESAIKARIKLAYTVRFTISMIELEIHAKRRKWCGMIRIVIEILRSFIPISWGIIWIKIGWHAYNDAYNEREGSIVRS